MKGWSKLAWSWPETAWGFWAWPETNISRILSRKKFNSRVIFVDIWSKRVFYAILDPWMSLIFGFDCIGRIRDRFLGEVFKDKVIWIIFYNSPEWGVVACPILRYELVSWMTDWWCEGELSVWFDKSTSLNFSWLWLSSIS